MDRTTVLCAIVLGIFMLIGSVYSYFKLHSPSFAAFALFVSGLSFVTAYLATLGRRQGTTAFYFTLGVHFIGLALFEWYG